MSLLAHRSALVTGSTSGIGLAIAQALAAAGARVMLNGMGSLAEIERTRAALAAETGSEIRFNGADVSQPAQVAALVAETEAAFGAVDILVNNTGVQFVSTVEDFPAEQWDRVRSIILDSTFHATRAVIPGMRRRNWGRILNLVSVHGLVASPFKSAYVAAKHGQVGFTKTVALELAETGITCNAICPGYVRTPLVDGQIEAQAATHGLSRDRVIREVILAAQPSKRFVTTEEVADLTLFLCGEAARSITGAAIPIDGGWTAR